MEFKGYDGGWCPKHKVAMVYSHLYDYMGRKDERKLNSGKIIKVNLKKHRRYLGVLWRCPIRYCHQKRKEKGRRLIGNSGRDSKGRRLADRRRI